MKPFQKDIVYKTPGKHKGPAGSTYEYAAVNTQEDLDVRLKSGWFNSLMEAVAGKSLKVEAEDHAAPTRDEVKQKADELGIKYKPNVKTDKLQKMVEDKIDELDQA